MKKRVILIQVIEVMMIVFFSLLMIRMDTVYVTSWFREDMESILSELKQKLDDANALEDKNFANYEVVQRHSARLAAYYLEQSADDTHLEQSLQELQNLLSVEGLYILDLQGNTLCSAFDQYDFDFTDEAFAPLLNISEEYPVSNMFVYDYDRSEEDDEETEDGSLTETSLPSEEEERGQTEGEEEEQELTEKNVPGFLPDEIEGVKEDEETEQEVIQDNGIDQNHYFVSSLLAPNRILILNDELLDFNNVQSASETSISIFSRAKYGKNGFCFEVYPNKSGYFYHDGGMNFSYDVEEQHGISAECLEDGYSGICTIDDSDYFCYVKWYEEEEIYLFCVIPLAEVRQSVLFVCLGSVLFVVASMLLMCLYAGRLVLEHSRKKNQAEAFGVFRKKLLVFVTLCIVILAGVNIYSKTLYFFSYTITDNVSEASILQETMDSITKKQETGAEVYNNAVSAFTRTAARIISGNPEFQTRKKLKELAEILGVEHILVYDRTGEVKASDLNYTGLSVSHDPQSLSYEFLWVLYGEELLIQDKIDETYLNHPYLFSGAPIRNGDGEYDGFVQLAFEPSFRERMVASTSVDFVLSSYGATADAFAFAVDNETGLINSAKKQYNQKDAKGLGLTDEELQDGFLGFFSLSHRTLLGSCNSSVKYWTFIASYTEKILLDGIRYGILSSLPGIIGEILLFLLLLAYGRRFRLLTNEELKNLTKNQREDKLKADERLHLFLKNTALIVTGFIAVLSIAGKYFFTTNALEYYVFVYPWSKGFHIFTFTRCLIILCCVAFTISCMLKLFGLLGKLLPSKQETVIRMLVSFMKYASFLGTLFFCLTLLGVPTASLLASAGIMSIVLSMGAQSLVADIFAGLFIVFEGTFRVGDMITVNDWHGQVVEIGLRNTTILDLVSSDIKIMNNSMIKSVVNYSLYPSLSAIRVGVNYDYDLDRLEEIIEREKDVIKRNIPYMIGDLMYLGVDEFADSAVILKFQVACKNQDYLKAKRALYREIKLMFDRNGIEIPYPRSVVIQGSGKEEKIPEPGSEEKVPEPGSDEPKETKKDSRNK